MNSEPESLIITPKEAFIKYKEEVKKNKSATAKGSTFESLTDVLNEFDIDVLPKPSTTDLAKIWKSERDKLMLAFSRVLADNNKKKKKSNSKCHTFFDSANYLNLCKVRSPKEPLDETFEVNNNASDTDNEAGGAKLGQPVRHLIGLGPRQLNNRTKALRSTVKDFCASEKVPVDKVLGIIGKSNFFSNGSDRDQAKGDMFKKIAEGKDPFEKKEMNVDQGVYVQDSLGIGRTRYTDHAKFLKQFDLKCPNPANIRKRRLEFTPEILEGPNEGVWVNLYEACKLITKETIVHLAKDNFDKLVNEDPVNWLLDVELDCGLDGSGRFKIGISGFKFIYK